MYTHREGTLIGKTELAGIGGKGRQYKGKAGRGEYNCCLNMLDTWYMCTLGRHILKPPTLYINYCLTEDRDFSDEI